MEKTLFEARLMRRTRYYHFGTFVVSAHDERRTAGAKMRRSKAQWQVGGIRTANRAGNFDDDSYNAANSGWSFDSIRGISHTSGRRELSALLPMRGDGRTADLDAGRGSLRRRCRESSRNPNCSGHGERKCRCIRSLLGLRARGKA